MDNMLEELNCPICLEFFTCPVILPCSHILCRSPCAERLFEQNFIRCPVCRDNCYVAGGIDVLPRVISLENIIERYQEEEDIEDEDDDGEGNTSIGGVPCQLCTSQHARRAKKSCMDCNASYCSNCLEITHPNREPFNQHTLVAPTHNPRPKVIQCTQHREVVNAYCVSCKMLACAVCVHAGVHQGHRLLPVDEAFQELRSSLEVSMKSTESSQEAAAEAVKSEEDQLKVYQEIAARRRQDIDEQCNSLIAFIEAKRRFFHSDLDLEEQGQVAAVRVAVSDHKKLTAESQSLVHYAKLVMKETDPASFLQIAGTINERLIKSCGRVEELHMPPVETEKMRTKILDLRKQKAIMKDMQYLTLQPQSPATPKSPVIAPQSPAIDVTKCSRSSNCVILVLSKNSGYEVVDGYHVLYCAEGEETETPQVHRYRRARAFANQSVTTFSTQSEEPRYGTVTTTGNAVVLMIENLENGTKYFFCVRGFNAAGESANSEVVNCTTLEEEQEKLIVPEIVPDNCHTYMSSIQIYCSSQVATPSPTVNFYLLHREAESNTLWRSTPLYACLDHRVFGLEQDKPYEFVVLACNSSGEAQLSNKVVLRTQGSSS